MKRLVSLNHRDGSYERPNQDFTCGRAKNGDPCALGPRRDGSCRGGYECRPLRKNDRYHCTRPPTAGGPCESGPLPDGSCCRPILKCRPQMNHRRLRGTLVRWVATFTVAALLLVLAGGSYLEFITPGPMSKHHGGNDLSCNACHSAADGSAAGLLSLAFDPGAGDDQSSMCTQCHPMGDNPLASHGLPVEEMTIRHNRIIKAGHTGGVGGFMKMRERDFRQDTECKFCHTEHKGKLHRSAVMDNQCCQSCHERVFDGLAFGHPDFDQYPNYRRTRIIFDHVSHLNKHFAETPEKAPDTCADCHTLDNTGAHMLIRGFDETCASCHDGDIKGETAAGIKGFQVLAVPGLDAESLADAGIHIGEWPFFAENPITPYMKLLLSAEPGVAEDLSQIQNLDLLDLSGATTEQKQAAGRVAWQVKTLLDQLNMGGQTDLAQHLGDHVDPRRLPQLTAQLSPADVRDATGLWFPNLKTELADHRAGKQVKAPKKESKKAVKAPKPATKSSDDILAGDDDILAGDDDILAGNDDILGGDDDILAGDDDILGGDDDILAGDDNILGGDDDILAGDEDLSQTKTKNVAITKPITEEEWVAMGGWFQNGFALYYRPTGHEDSFLKAWLDLTADHTKFEHPQFAEAVFEALADPKAPGSCTKCHSIDKEPSGMELNWMGKRHDPNRKEFTKFTHQPHQSLIGHKGCIECHAMDNDAAYADSFANRDPETFSSNFTPTRLETCVACHSPSGSGDECLDCHNYHIGVFAEDHLDKAKLKHMGGTGN